jgi:hypothetical protein
MKELSVFVDESGDFGPYERHSPYYIVTLVFHDQSVNITKNINHLNEKVCQSGLPDNPFHAGPLIRKENEYRNLALLARKRIFNFLYNFVRTADITYRSIIVEKKQLVDEIDLHVQITKQLSTFLKEHMDEFMQYGCVLVYYDYGQMELTKILVSVFNAVLNNVEFRKVIPANYKLFQAADMLCSLELLSKKAEQKTLSKSELLFFSSERDLHKSYLKAIFRKRF